MYETFFQMEHTPFSRNTPVADLYESPAMADTLGRLAYAADRQLFAVVTADAGCGKSTLIRRFVTSLPKEEYLFLYLSDSKLTPRWFYKGMLDQLGIESKFYRGDAKRQLQKEVEIIRGVQKKKVVCILDEAHLLELFLWGRRNCGINSGCSGTLLSGRGSISTVSFPIWTVPKPNGTSSPIWLMPAAGRTSSRTKHWMISIRSPLGSPAGSTGSVKRA